MVANVWLSLDNSTIWLWLQSDYDYGFNRTKSLQPCVRLCEAELAKSQQFNANMLTMTIQTLMFSDEIC